MKKDVQEALKALQEPHTPDSDLQAYLSENHDIYTLEEIAAVHATVPGHNEGDHWYWVLELKNGAFVLTSAWCDYSGWGCQSGGESRLAASAEAAAEAAPADTEYRKVRSNLIAQVLGAQPYGLEIW